MKTTEAQRRAQKRYREKNLEKLRAKRRAWYQKNRKPGTTRAYPKHKTEVERVLARRVARKKWKQANKEKTRLYNREYQRRFRGVEKNRKAYSEKECARIKARLKIDPGFRLTHNLRGRVRGAVVRGSKSARTLELLGCPGIWLQVHLESLFRPGMTWENYGHVWHVDHKKPCAKFDLSDPEQQRICFHWTNLQPLFVEENLRKGAKYG